MRFVIAIAAFVVAAVLVTVGFAQRTVWLASDTVEAKASGIHTEASLVIIDGDVLTSQPGRQTLDLLGSGTIFVAYGRTPDVMAWVGESSYLRLGLDEEAGQLTEDFVPGQPTKEADAGADPGAGADAGSETSEEELVPNPAGSDLWLNEYVQEEQLTASFSLPDDNSVIIASDGSPDPVREVSISWPVDNSTPWSLPLIISGALMLLVGLALYLNALLHLRRTRGPRRRSPKIPKPPKPGTVPRRSRASQSATLTPPRGRRSGRRTMVAALPLFLISALALSACTAGSPSSQSTTTSTTAETEEPETPKAPPVAVTLPQVENIIARIVTVADAGDASLDATVLEPRFSGLALELRKANYTIRSRDSAVAPIPSIPDGPPVFTLPQQTEEWPRTVMTVVQEGEGAESRQVMLVLVQKTPRNNYTVDYATTLRKSLPEVPAVQVGAGRIEGDSTLVKIAPNALSAAYADILNQGEASPSFAAFDPDDPLQAAYGAAFKQRRIAAPGSGAMASFLSTPNPVPAIALSTTDAGALVAVSLVEHEKVVPAAKGDQVKVDGDLAQLLGSRTSTVGIQASYGYQLLFYVPISGSEEQVQLLGYSQGLVAAVEKG